MKRKPIRSAACAIHKSVGTATVRLSVTALVQQTAQIEAARDLTLVVMLTQALIFNINFILITCDFERLTFAFFNYLILGAHSPIKPQFFVCLISTFFPHDVN
jgi:hypothetical protein